MKSKKSLYFLLPLVGVVWGLIIYRIIQYTQPSIDFVDSKLMISSENDSISYSSQKKLLLNYADPFLNEVQTTSVESKQSAYASVFLTNPEPSQKEVVWPLIAYKGMIKNGQQLLGIVEIDTKKSLVSDGIRLKELTIKKVYSDSIVIVLDKNTKTFYKK
jgi:hypothetical protein